MNILKKKVRSNIYQTVKMVFDHICKQNTESKIRLVAEYF